MKESKAINPSMKSFCSNNLNKNTENEFLNIVEEIDKIGLSPIYK